jgi:hypothetical protein
MLPPTRAHLCRCVLNAAKCPAVFQRGARFAALAAEAVAGTGVAGAVVSAGPAIDPKAPEEEYTGRGGIVGLRTRLDPLRFRETIIVPLSPAGARRKQVWRGIYEAETHWLKDSLVSASLPGFEEIERGWSVPVD